MICFNLEKEKKRLQDGEFTLQCCRLNWSFVTKNLIVTIGEKWQKKLESIDYPLKIFLISSGDEKNYETIQFNMVPNHLGITRENKNGIEHFYESGCSLVFSQSMVSKISIIIYPYKSKACQRLEDNIIIKYNLHPNEVTKKTINEAFEMFLFYGRVSSQYGISNQLSFCDKFNLIYMKFNDIRLKQKRKLNFFQLKNEWLKQLLTAILTIVTAIITTVLTGNYLS
ncbi:hypothetical protein FD722_19880 [Photobacterium damselae subsp. damselae]|uniref:hypothetical protein n=1 Tax=Photobacterium damselae TaxID=38293 RepID=UPI0010FCFDDE|nr:hypothetical protein [Photobacterium damselae]MBA5683506.1 hypothetical protein [Photobacterium damselae subsp. damselae]TLS80000.1 hypothetical protein FD719_19745 [Photobacterium damselae subsp. damselae]TLS84343.1 hypothetical protein FD722_19880 [Photobacterium damselae subsp. damselae]